MLFQDLFNTGGGLLIQIYRDAQLKWDLQWYMYSQLYIMGIIFFLYRDYEGADRIRMGRGVRGRGDDNWKGGEIIKILSAHIARRSEKREETRGGGVGKVTGRGRCLHIVLPPLSMHVKVNYVNPQQEKIVLLW